MLDQAFGTSFTQTDWEHALGGTHVVVVAGGAEVLCHAAVVERVLEVNGDPVVTGYVEAVATHPDHRREGHASRVMGAVNQLIEERFAMGALSTDRHTFYERLGWERWQGPSHVRRGVELIRTPDEDDGIMVLRCGQILETSLPIACAARSGDDW
jgi:aminoglycoside 2'-N-acetyltransferase I